MVKLKIERRCLLKDLIVCLFIFSILRRQGRLIHRETHFKHILEFEVTLMQFLARQKERK